MDDSPDRARALRLLAGGAVGGGAAWLVCLIGAWLWLGADALPWAGLGGAAVLAFFALGQLVQVGTAQASPTTVMTASLASYAVRAAGLALVLVLVQPFTAVAGAGALAPTIVVVVLGWLGAEIWAFSRLRVPSFDPPRDGGD